MAETVVGWLEGGRSRALGVAAPSRVSRSEIGVWVRAVEMALSCADTPSCICAIFLLCSCWELNQICSTVTSNSNSSRQWSLEVEETESAWASGCSPAKEEPAGGDGFGGAVRGGVDERVSQTCKGPGIKSIKS